MEVSQEIWKMEQTIRNLAEFNSLGLRPKNFNGTTDPEEFFKKFERWADYGGCDDEKKAKVIPLLLEEKASDFFDSLEEEKRNNFEDLKKALLLHFECNKSRLERWSDLFQKRMTLNQSVSDVHDDCRHNNICTCA